LKRIDKDILKLAAPAIINNITVPLLGLADTAIAGHLGDVRCIGAMSVGAMMINIFFWLAGFLRMGTTGLTARCYGEKDFCGCRDVLRKSLIIAAVLSALALMFQRPLLSVMLHFISPGAETAGLASLYFDILIWGVPAQLTVMAVSGWFIGLQTTLVPMSIAIGMNILNIIISLTLVFIAKAGFAGIAYGTLCANWLGAAAAIIWAVIKIRKLNFRGYEGFSRGHIKWRELFAVNGNLFIRSASIMAVTLTVTSVGARLGDLTLACNALIMQFFLFFSYFMDGFAFSGEALVGKFYGAGEGGMIVKTMKRLLLWGAAMALIFFLIYLFFTGTISRLLTNESEVTALVERYRIWILLLPPVTVAAFIFDGVYVGLTRTGAMMIATVVGAAAFFAVINAAGKGMDNDILWLAFELYLFLRGILLAIDFMLIERKKLNL